MATNTDADVEQAHDEEHPMVYGIGQQKLPRLLEKSNVAIFINKAVEAAQGIDACLNVILANECAKDNAQSDGQLILDRHTEQGLICAALAAAYFISDSGEHCLETMEAQCRITAAGEHPSRF